MDTWEDVGVIRQQRVVKHCEEGKRWKGMNRKGRTGGYLHVEKKNIILKRKRVSFLFLYFKSDFINLFYLCLAF